MVDYSIRTRDAEGKPNLSGRGNKHLSHLPKNWAALRALAAAPGLR